MKLKGFSRSARLIAAILLSLQLPCQMASASSPKEQIEKAKALHQLAIEQHEQGNHTETIRLVKQAFENIKDAYKSDTIRSSISDSLKTFEAMEGKPENAAVMYLHILKTYLSDENIKKLQMAEAHTRYEESARNDRAKAESVYKQQSKMARKERNKKVKKIAEATSKKVSQGEELSKDKLRQQVIEIGMADIPRQKAMMMQRGSHALDSLHEVIGLSGDYQEAFHKFTGILTADKKFIDEVLGFIPESQQLDYLIAKQKNLHAFLSLVVNHLPQDPNARRAAFDTWISRKGLVLEAQRRFQEALVYSDDPETLQALQQLSKVRAQLSKLFLAGPGKSSTEDHQKRIADLEEERQQLETKLTRLSESYALKKKINEADSRKIAAQMPKGAVLLDFARINIFDFDPDDMDKRWQPAHYVVFVLHAGSGEHPDMIDLGSAEKIDKTIENFKNRLKEAKGLLDSGDDLSKNGRNMKGAAQRLNKLVFAPITGALGDARELYISPDGNLSLIPFEVMQNPQEKYLIEDYTFNYLATSRDVLGFGQIKDRAGKSVIIGDPDFDLGNGSPSKKAPALPNRSPNHATHRSIQMAEMHFERLPNTRQEVTSIRDILGKNNATLYLYKEAIEAALFGHKAPRILHLATHGFFFDDQDSLNNNSTGQASPDASQMQKEKQFFYENPLLRSGIALAGANTTLEQQGTQKSDGIVTAEKILGLKLRGTEMVVLSACQTGEGQVQSGEGVFGLRRAFIQAGARSLVMSMWSVPDQETQELMVQFYKNITSEMNRSQALRQAALNQMQITKKRYGHAHPLFWGAFVSLGEV